MEVETWSTLLLAVWRLIEQYNPYPEKGEIMLQIMFILVGLFVLRQIDDTRWQIVVGIIWILIALLVIPLLGGAVLDGC